MQTIVMTRGCDAPRTLETDFADLLEKSLGPGHHALRVEVYLDASTADPQAWRLQANIPPYGSLGSETFQPRDATSLRRALEVLAWRARSAVRLRAAVYGAAAAG